MKTILTLLLSLLTLLSFSSNDTTHVSKSFKNGNSKINIEFLSFGDSLGNMTTRIKSSIECDSIFLIGKNTFSKTRNGVTLINKDGVGFISQFHFKNSDISSIKYITIYLKGELLFFEDGGHEISIVNSGTYLTSVHSPLYLPIELSSGDLLIQAGREKNLAIGLYALSMSLCLLSTLPNAPDREGIIATSGMIFAIGIGFNISGNVKISKAGKLMNQK